MGSFLFTLGVALLFAHELDAMLREEWALLYVLRSMPSESAAWWFIYLHVPLFMLILMLGYTARLRVRTPFRLAVCAFLVVHAGLHTRLSTAAEYHFHHPLSELLIYAAGLAGAAYLLHAAWGRRHKEEPL